MTFVKQAFSRSVKPADLRLSLEEIRCYAILPSRKPKPQLAVVNRPPHTLSVPHKMISKSPACLNCS
jgi:hypothetical protein